MSPAYYNCDLVLIPMEDHRLRSFCLVVETKSFSRAAQAMHMTQSAMSRLVKNLENKLGVTLLLRRGHAVVPTPEGKLLYEHAQKILTAYDVLESSIGSSSRASKSVLRVGVSRTPAIRFLPQVLYGFSKSHPEIKFDLSVYKTSGILRDLREGWIDIGIVEGNTIDSTISAETIAEDEVVIIAPENHPLAKKKTIALRDLTAESFILPDRESEIRELVNIFFREAGVDPKRIKARMTLGSPELIVQMVQAGLGIAFASKWSLFTAMKEGTVKILRMPGRKIKQNFYLVGADKDSLSGRVQMFREFIKKQSFVIPF